MLFDDGGLNWYDYGFRNYDPQIGRFTQLDPLTDDYSDLTPYQYAINDPILNIDIDGLEGVTSILSKVAGEGGSTAAKSLPEFKTLTEVKIFAVLPKVAKAGTSILSKAGTALNAVGNGISWFAKGLWNEGVVPTVDQINHNLNPIYGVFNGINSQFTHQDYLNGTPMTRAEGIMDAALPFIPFGKVGGVVDKIVLREIEAVATKTGFKTLSELGLRDGMKVSSSRALELGEQFLGKGYKELVRGSGRYVSADGTRIFRMGENDITGAHGGGPHVNFETLIPNPAKPLKMMVDKNYHIYLTH